MAGKGRRPRSSGGVARLLLAFAFAGCVSPALAQERVLNFQRIASHESFAPNQISHIAEDDRGFLWFSSLVGGFARYDGYEFKTYRHVPGERGGLPSNQGRCVYPDEDGSIWFCTGDGLARLDPDTEHLTVYRHDPADPRTLPDDGVNRILRDSQGILWVGTDRGIARMGPGENDFRRYPLTPRPEHGVGGVATSEVYAIYEDRLGHLWVGVFRGGLLRYDRAADRFVRYVADREDPQRLPHHSVRVLFEDSSGRLWVGTDGGLAIITDRLEGVFERVVPDEAAGAPARLPVFAIAEDHAGNLWFTAYESALVRFADSGQFKSFVHDPGDPASLGRGVAWDVHVDRQGNVWYATDVINRLMPAGLAFAVYESPEAFTNPEAALLYDSNGRFWASPGGQGFYDFDPATGEWRPWMLWPELEGVGANNWVRGAGFYERPDGRIWVVTNERLNLLDPQTGEFVSRDLPEGPHDMILGSDGLIWAVLPFNGLAAYDFDEGNLTLYQHDPGDENTISHDFGNFVHEDAAGWLWYGTHLALDRFDRATGSVRHYTSDPADPNTLTDSAVYSVLGDSLGRLWFGTANGLNLYLPAEDRFVRHYNGSEPGDNDIRSMVEGPDGRLWLDTAAGLARFDPGTGEFVNWSTFDGVPAGLTGLTTGPEGRLFGISARGIVRIDTDRLEVDVEPPPVLLTRLRVNNDVVRAAGAGTGYALEADIASAGNLRLDHSARLVSFGFASPDFRHTGDMRYRYRMHGLQRDWIVADAAVRRATYTNLPPGRYTLEVQAAVADGEWGPVEALAVKVKPPPWRTVWAYALYAVIAMALLLGVIRWRTGLLRVRARQLQAEVDRQTGALRQSAETIRQQSSELQDLLETKDRLFTNVSHEFRTPLTLMLAPIRNAMAATRDRVLGSQLEMAHRNGQRVLRLVNQLLEISRLGASEPLRREPGPLAPIVENLTEAFVPSFCERSVGLKRVLDDSLWTDVPSEAVERILMNLLSNALKFTPDGGSVTVVTAPGNDDFVELRVADTGAGIAPAEQRRVFERFHRADDAGEQIPGSGVGLALVRETVEAYGGSIDLESAPGEGTTFTVRLPRCAVPRDTRVAIDAPPSAALQLEIEAARRSPEHPAAAAREAGDERPLVLVIEDNSDMRAYLRQLLADDYAVEGVADGEAGLEAALELVPDLVLCDLMLPRLDGYGVAHALRENEATSHVPIILLTARDDEASRLAGLREQVDDYITKPFNDEEVRLRIANAIAVREIMRARFARDLQDDRESSDTLGPREQAFIERVDAALARHYDDMEFTVTGFAAAVHMSERQLQRKLKAITDQTPAQYLRLYRLKRALPLIVSGQPIGDVAFAVGFKSQSHFANCFKAQYGRTPSEYRDAPRSLGSRA